MSYLSFFNRACAAQAKSLREFGYPDVTADFVKRAHGKWQRGEPLTDVAEMFCERAFEEYPDLFGTKEASK